MFNILDKVVLEDNKEYIVASNATIAEENFYLLVDKNDNQNIRYMREGENGESLIQINDLELLEDIAIVLYANAKKIYKDLLDK